jgi:membrane-anchored protein YejM (alkaline phosphatase superfamily)
MTFSYLPSFCLPYFQYSLIIIFLTLCCHFFRLLRFLQVFVQAAQLCLLRQHRQFYVRRFKANLKMIQLVLRSILPLAELPESRDISKGAQKVLSIVLTGFPQIQTFSPRFFAQCNHSFMAPCRLS